MKKIRITLLNNQNEIISDRLVEQNLELSTGPKEKHDGPMRVEFNAYDKQDVELLKGWLDRLSGNLPLPEKPLKSLSPSTKKQPMEKESLNEMVHTMIQKYKYQEDIIEYLRKYNFRFISADHLVEVNEKNDWEFKFKKPLHSKWQYMVRIVKEAKDPKNDQYDMGLAVGIKFSGKKYNKILFYLYGKLYKVVKFDWKDAKNINFKKPEKVYKFPAVMTYDERAKYRAEDRKLKLDTNLIPSKFYERWKPYVKELGTVDQA